MNDRPYAASSLLAVALGKVFASAGRGLSKERPELAAKAIPLEVFVPAVPCWGGAEMVERFFGPLGRQVTATPVPLDERFPDWDDSRYLQVRLTGTLRLADAINHLYVGLPVLDDGKHYWVSTDEIDELLRAGEGWLADLPVRVTCGLVRRWGRPRPRQPVGHVCAFHCVDRCQAGDGLPTAGLTRGSLGSDPRRCRCAPNE